MSINNTKIKYAAYLILAITVVAFWAQFAHIKYTAYKNRRKCNVQIINLTDTIYPTDQYDDNHNLTGTNSFNVVRQIDQAEADKTIKAIILYDNSGGGDPVAGEQVAEALKNAGKPSVALIASNGTSAAYWAATGAGRIIASANAYVGDIGVTSSYLDNEIQNKNQGLTFNTLSSGKYKDIFNSNKPLTPDEKALAETWINTIKENFVDAVAQNRHLEKSKVEAMADGAPMLGAEGLKNGLIDQIGGIYEVKDYLKQKLGADINICH